MIYETLLVFNQLQNTVTPWLASSYNWSQDFTHLTLTIRANVTWTDGQPFTGDDVVYTLNLLRQHPQMDTYGVSKFIKSVANPSSQEVSSIGSGNLWVQAEVTTSPLGVLAASFNYMVKQLSSLLEHGIINRTPTSYHEYGGLLQ